MRTCTFTGVVFHPFSERLREVMESSEDLQEKRMDLLAKSIRRNNKRKRVVVDDDDECGSVSSSSGVASELRAKLAVRSL